MRLVLVTLILGAAGCGGASTPAAPRAPVAVTVAPPPPADPSPAPERAEAAPEKEDTADPPPQLPPESVSTKVAPKMRFGTVVVAGKLPAEVLQRIVRQNFGYFRRCYEAALAKDPSLSGTVRAHFVIESDGSVRAVRDGGSGVPDAALVRCVLDSFALLSFPAPESGVVTVEFPVSFSGR